MNKWKEMIFLTQKEVELEFKTKSSIGSILLYLVSTIFVAFLSFKKVVDIPTWIALYWIIMLFASVNAVSKSFLEETKGTLQYYFTIVSPEAYITSKILYNSILLCLVSLISYVIYSLFIGSDIIEGANTPLFLLTLAIGAIGFASVFGMVSSIALKTDNNLGIVAILGFPLILPFLLTLIKTSKQALDGFKFETASTNLAILTSIIVLVISLSYILFPYLWRD
jgi:heme exporter protein B